MPLSIIEDETSDVGTNIDKDETLNIANLTTENDKHILKDNKQTEERKGEQSSCTLQESRSCNVDNTPITMCGKLCKWFAAVETKLTTGEGKQDCDMVNITDVLCDDVEHSKL
eukprot:11326523-Ditylum_brightwellii.AAC.1